MPDSSISETLHAKLDAIGAPARAIPPAGETPQIETADDSREALVADADPMPDETALGEIPEGGEVAGEGEAEETIPQSLVDFAKAAGWEPADVYSLSMTLDDGGDGRDPTTLRLGEIKDKLQQYAASEAELQQQRAQLDQEVQAFRQYAGQQQQGQQAMTEELAQATQRVAEVKAQHDSIDWDKLRESDPSRYAAAKQDFGVALANANQAARQAGEQAQYQQQTYQQQRLQFEGNKLLDLVPEWRDEQRRTTEVPQVQEYLMSRGFDPTEIQHLYHGGAYAVARDGMLWRQHQAEVEKARGKVRKAPSPVMRPGSGNGMSQHRSKQLDALERRARETGRTDHKMAAMRALFENLPQK